MRRLLHALAVAAVLSGCGGVSNAPLRRAEVVGVAPAAAAGGFVGLIGDWRGAVVRDDGSFTLSDVAPGAYELVLLSAAAVARVPVELSPGKRLDVGAPVTEVPAWVDLTVAVSDRFSTSGVRVSVEGLPYQSLHAAAGGTLSVGPLPSGCHRLLFDARGFQSRESTVCVGAGERVVLPMALSSDGTATCEVQGCAPGFLCGADGRCVVCRDAGDCRSGSCAPDGESCLETNAATCAPCDGDADCGAGARCAQFEGTTRCLSPCAADGSCRDPGTTCTGRTCVPDGARYRGCYGYLRAVATCADDADCEAHGLIGASCYVGRCAASCVDDGSCALGSSCGGMSRIPLCIGGAP